jgi:hypothetical protein
MSVSGAIKAGAAYVEFSIRDTVSKDLNAIGGKLKSAGGSIAALGAGLAGVGSAALGPLAAATATFMDMGGALDDLSQRTGASVEFLSGIGHAALMSGSSLEAVTAGMAKLQKAAAAAGNGSASPEELMLDAADAIAAMKDPTAQAAKAMELFGKKGVELLPMLKGGREGIAAMLDESKALGLTMSGEDAAAAAALGDAWDTLKEQGKAIAFNVGAAMASTLTDIAKRASETVAVVIAWVKENRGLILSIAKAAAVVAGIGAAIATAGMAIAAIGAMFTGAAAILGTFVGAITAVASGFAFLLSPVGLVLAALAGAAYVWATFTDSGQSAVSSVMGWLGEMKDFALETWGGISDAFAAGDLTLAAEIAWLSLKVIWTEGVNSLLDIWYGLRDTMMSVLDATISYIKTAWRKMSGWLGEQIAKVMAWFMGEDPDQMAKMVGDMTKSQVADLEREKRAREDERAATSAAKLEGNEAELEALRQERDKAIAEAAAKKEAADQATGATARATAGGSPQVAAAAVAAVAMAARAPEVLMRGSVGAATREIQTGQDQAMAAIQKATVDTAGYLKSIDRRLEQSPVVVSLEDE